MTAEFTGERVVPGQVDVDLWNEHFARYLFAKRFAHGKRVLDAGCGMGYGSYELSRVAASVTAFDIAAEAVDHASQRNTGVSFVQSSCSALPFRSGSFDLIVMYEVIEHVRDWADVLRESARALSTDGHLIVSTPNKSFYSQTRDEPNPFHEHEFEYDEFRSALSEVFPSVTMFLEDHAGVILFRSADPSLAHDLQVNETSSDPERSSFFVAVCGQSPVTPRSFVYLPGTSNMLGEKLEHIRRLEGEVRTKDSWIAQEQSAHGELLRHHTEQLAELEKSNRWGMQLEADLHAARERIAQALTAIAELNALVAERTEWAQAIEQRLTADLAACAADRDQQTAELGRCVELLQQNEATLIDRTKWAISLNEEKTRLEADVAAARASRWVRLGRAVGLGPELQEH